MRTSIALAFAAVILASVFASCSSEDYKYDYTCNGQKTGEQKFDSKEAYCAGLQNFKLNNDGACYDMRKSAFETSCSGTFTES